MRSIGTLTAHEGSSSVQGSVEPARREVVTDQDQRRDAVDRAYREHADDVYRVAFAILRDTEAAVDATHDTFARAFERWNQYDSNRSLQAWLAFGGSPCRRWRRSVPCRPVAPGARRTRRLASRIVTSSRLPWLTSSPTSVPPVMSADMYTRRPMVGQVRRATRRRSSAPR